MKVTRSEPVLVHAAGDTPAPAAAEEYYFLSNLDQNVAVLMKTVHVFTSSSSSETPPRRGSAATVIRESLSTVLRSYYPFEGALAVRPDGRLAVRNARRGVPFVEAAADGELREVTDDVSAPGAASAAAAVLVYVDDAAASEENNPLEAPLLTVQVTSFACGGFVLGLAMNHCLADGQSAAAFLRSWSEAARGAPPSAAAPWLDRTLQRARPVPTVGFAHDEFTEIEDVSGGLAAGAFGGSGAPTVYRSFTLDAGKLERLRIAASGGGDGAAASAAAMCSTFVALTAFVWVARTRALGMRPEQRSKLLFAVDVRRRVSPPLPDGFWGNAVVFACCISGAGDLVGGPLSAAARSVRDAIARTDDAFVRSAIDYIEINRGARPSLTATTLVTAWNVLGLHTADFGWGEAVHSGPAELPQKEVVLILRGVRDSRSRVLVVGLPPSCMQAFQEMVDQL
ncbi:unnamed protein product [Urochloa decumbens]|uniref:Uncharacterized protein n=1 Tax=Urochloa decumbens TaxID=240449 RepID=A0ABC8YEE7_9POAL